ncbi:hypothetical protein SAMN05216262_11370 [Colwellia chukchiensis]|uniref:Orphan protein n=1 Tax=Colwellia chukchiensis TaxID=641665 RepID=A0A1H7R3K5_9GAMM|nr:hypothetical protein [Colwellia chukchiensis]SEL54811.1 hypothetical protein SAMN05216262_11370 [Colwellia chukchiensis]
MRKLLTSPNAMALSASEQSIYQNTLTFVADLSLNLMAVKVTNHPDNFLDWCKELHRICAHDLNRDLLNPDQEKPLKKLQQTLANGVSACQLKMARVIPWPLFVNFMHDNASRQALTERLRLLDYLSSICDKSFSDMSEEDRLAFAGKHTARHDISVYDFDVEWFASTRAANTFHQYLQTKPQAFDQALAHIPLAGEVTESDYLRFVDAFKAIFAADDSAKNATLSVATRLLAMRRPDQFIALTSTKMSSLSVGLGVVKLNQQSFDDYWHEMILTLRNTAWWRSDKPSDETELKLWQYRATLIDLFLFADNNLAANSNYLKMRDKPSKTKIGVVRSLKRSKESAEAIVDKALAEDDLPDFIHNMRSTIVNSVKDGKTVDQAITLMRNIFG